MIDINKKYTYNGNPVRIYTDGSDTYSNKVHGAVLHNERWEIQSFYESDLIEVWEPVDDELVWCWDEGDTLPQLLRYDKRKIIWENFAQFRGELPKELKGLV